MTVIEEKGPISGIGLWLGILVLFLLFISGFWWYQVKTSGPFSTVAPEKSVAPGIKHTLKVSFSNLRPLKKGHFEIWAEFKDKVVSVGRFNLDNSGTLLDLEGKEVPYSEFKSKSDLSKADRILVSIEPEGDKDASPSGVLILEGEIYGERADLSFKAITLAKASGEYFLGTPSYSKDPDLPSGVWFAKPAGREFDKQDESLILGKAPEGFVYEGWVFHRGEFISVGRFKSPVGDDDFSNHSGLRRYPDYPGEDFLINEPEGLDFDFPIELADGESKVIISLEPDIEGEDPTGEGPFQLQFLKADIPEGADVYTLYKLDLDLSGLPTGTVEVK